MTRTTDKELNDLAERISKALGWDYRIDRAYGKVMLVKVVRPGSTGYREVSPRMTRGQLQEWIWAFLEGIGACREAIERMGP